MASGSFVKGEPMKRLACVGALFYVSAAALSSVASVEPEEFLVEIVAVALVLVAIAAWRRRMPPEK